MSTNAGVRILQSWSAKDPATQLAEIYRHWDGYPAVTGASIVEALRITSTASAFAGALLSQTSAGRMPPSADYELCGDLLYTGCLEYVYVLTFNGNDVSICYHVRGRDEAPEFPKWHQKEVHTIPSFVEVVNRDRLAINKRLAELRAKNPNCSHYIDAEDFTVLEWSKEEVTA